MRAAPPCPGPLRGRPHRALRRAGAARTARRFCLADIDGRGPAFDPGNAITEISGLTAVRAPEIVRAVPACVVDGGLVEVSPPSDPSGNTAPGGAGQLCEMPCVLPGVRPGRSQDGDREEAR